MYQKALPLRRFYFIGKPLFKIQGQAQHGILDSYFSRTVSIPSQIPVSAAISDFFHQPVRVRPFHPLSIIADYQPVAVPFTISLYCHQYFPMLQTINMFEYIFHKRLENQPGNLQPRHFLFTGNFIIQAMLIPKFHQFQIRCGIIYFLPYGGRTFTVIPKGIPKQRGQLKTGIINAPVLILHPHDSDYVQRIVKEMGVNL
ncbi:hypothetical protein D3Z45_12320 [Lachnospiraceae bacterium]|nr:hypothetical protein [Lachnospiraceae bacterium]